MPNIVSEENFSFMPAACICTFVFKFIVQVKEIQVETIVDTLCTNMMSDKEQLRDISSIGLKTVIVELPPSATTLAAGISRKITGRLTNAVAKQVSNISRAVLFNRDVICHGLLQTTLIFKLGLGYS